MQGDEGRYREMQVDAHRARRLARAGNDRAEAGEQRLQRVERGELVVLELGGGEAHEEGQQEQRAL